MNNIKYITLTNKELSNINGGNIKFTPTNASYYPIKWGKNAGKWIISKIK